MKVVYAHEKPPETFSRSVFLAGPTPRSQDTLSWRPEALRLLKKKGYDGVVFVPENRNGSVQWSYDEQIAWERTYLEMADCIMFWVPRELKKMPAFTTNVEFGLYIRSGKVVFGAPQGAIKVNYLEVLGKEFLVSRKFTLEATIDAALEYLGSGALRKGGECQVPLCIWRLESFQKWYKAQKRAGNRIDGAKLLWTFRVGKKKEFIFCWSMHMDMFVASENRNKRNEIVISRTDISTVVVYWPNPLHFWDTIVLLIREYRSPASTEDAFIHELPGGSSHEVGRDPKEVAAEEVKEETGFQVDPQRLVLCGTRQLAGTFSTHKANVYALKLYLHELDALCDQQGSIHGVYDGTQNTERTYIELRTLKDIIEKQDVDWATMGMIFSTIVAN
jgi:8-oxo-dGTP pyrophosphatase MutT (NUDIX family)